MAILIDAHVHIYGEFVLENFFEAALNNFLTAVKKNDLPVRSSYVLALTEGGSCDFFSTLYDTAISLDELSAKRAETFVICKTEESNSLLLCKGQHIIILIAGRQLVSKENIEVLALFSPVRIEDKKLSLAKLTNVVADNGGLPVLAWGVGKWLGARRKVVQDLLDSKPEIPLFFGDNGNRPPLWKEPILLKNARRAAYPLLSGSDPLPFRSHVARPGSFGSFVDQESLPLDYPVDSLKKLLLQIRAKPSQLKPFGHLTGNLQFLGDQFKINLRKRIT